ncbi:MULTISPECIES: hypothetical protein [Pseudonocardia]|uniref:Uncharacterized protein n=2 Tax=Pseudonocardia TaxID=1847 RepID=A0A1Y2MT37_PSEAH|nr:MULTISPECIES: hypothetical protein [Pseudonocardia]OSY38149.1 hypothetical protein BG845_04322 [Pseudonocardia autotrophica]TDN75589.1 hypothetical protein C8E95_4767 [Pseudonocardia autotrophica]BBF99560.1 hypothetical protein Pdca_07700 [Pseudonocardia autotrophica]GEC27799.1 hypothetical protein PSA01_48280 [Pseudonocardia saturnea]
MDRTKWGAVALGAAGVAFAAYPALRPWTDGSQVWAQPLWVPSHLLGVVGFALLVPGLATVWARLRDTPGERAGWVALVSAGVGAALVLPYYGAEAYALHLIGLPESGIDAGQASALAEGIRLGPYAAATFLIGLLAVASAGIAVLVAARRGGLPVPAAAVLAVALVLYLPQFFAPPAMRIAHGVLLAVGCVLLAAALRTGSVRADRGAALR